MPRFFFNVSDTKTLFDPGGADLPNWQAARIFAIRYMGEILQSDAKNIAESDDCHMDVMDESGLIMMRLDFSVMLSSANSFANILDDDHAIHLAGSLKTQPAP